MGNLPLLCWCGRRDSICIFAKGKNYGVAPVQPGASNSPPDCCISMGSRPVKAQKRGKANAFPFSGADGGTRTRTAMPEEPKSTESTNSTTSAFGEYLTMNWPESQIILEISSIDPSPKL